MSLSTVRDRILGVWIGENLLRTTWLTPPEHLSPSRLSVGPAAAGKFLVFSYTWSHDNVEQEGLLLLGHDKQQDVATAAWVDSWHMSQKVMSFEGTVNADGVIDLRGSYEAPPGPDWGWRIVISSSAADSLEMVMYNISPEGVEDLAVRANYKRAN